MKSLLALLVVVPVCFAQKYTAPGRVVFTNPSGFGNVAYPGAGAAPQASFGYRLGQTVAGHPVGNGAPRSRIRAYPVFIGGGYGSYYADPSGYGYSSQEQPPVNVTVVNAPPQVPSVVINQNFGPQPSLDSGDPSGSDTTHIYRPAPPTVDDAAAEPAQPHYFLVAFKDHSVYSALAYWIEDKTLHYVTPQQTHNQASLDLIDLDFTKKLNQR